MGLTTSASITETIYTRVIETLLLAYQYDGVTALPFFRFRNMVADPSPVAGFPRAVKDATTDLATEATALVAVEFETTGVDVTNARVGIARDVSATAMEDSILGRALITRDLVVDAGILLGEAADTDGMALFAAATNFVANTGVDMTIANLVEGMATQRTAKARGPQVIHLHDEHLNQLQQAQVVATATPWETFYQPNADHSQFGGYFMGAPIWSSSLNPLNASGADRISCIWSQGQSAPAFCAFGHTVKRHPTTKFTEEILADSTVSATITRYGVGTIAANFATKLVFDA